MKTLLERLRLIQVLRSTQDHPGGPPWHGCAAITGGRCVAATYRRRGPLVLYGDQTTDAETVPELKALGLALAEFHPSDDVVRIFGQGGKRAWAFGLTESECVELGL